MRISRQQQLYKEALNNENVTEKIQKGHRASYVYPVIQRSKENYFGSVYELVCKIMRSKDFCAQLCFVSVISLY